MLRMRSNDVTPNCVIVIVSSSSNNSLNWCLDNDSVCHIYRLNTGMNCVVPGGDESTSDFQNRYFINIRFEILILYFAHIFAMLDMSGIKCSQ